MTDATYRAFLESIIETPDDDTPRLIFADWLEDRDDPRGEFIRIQCELARLSPWDSRRPLLRWRERALLDAYAQQWMAELPALVGIRWGKFERGFVSTIHTDSFYSFTKHGLTLPPVAPISSLVIENPDLVPIEFNKLGMIPNLRRLHIKPSFELIAHLERFCECPLLATLRVLEIERCNLENDGLRQLLSSPHLGNLEELLLPLNDIGSRAMHEFSRDSVLPCLKRLNLTGAGYGAYSNDSTLGGVGLATLARLPFLGRLTSLELARNEIDARGLVALLESPYVSRLERLDLRDNAIDARGRGFGKGPTKLRPKHIDLSENLIGVDLSKLIARGFLNEVESLCLAKCRISSTGVQALVKSPANSTMQRLDLHRNMLECSSMESITKADWPCLHTLDISDGELGESGANRLSKWEPLAQLVSLRISQNNIRDAGFAALVGGAPCRRLIDLDVGENGLGPASLPSFNASRFPRLCSLSLRRNPIGGDRVRALTEGEPIPHLKHLDLESVSLGDEGVQLLASLGKWTSLASLTLNHNGIKRQGILALATAAWAGGLRTLSLVSNGLAEEGMRALIDADGLANLIVLDVSYNEVTNAGFEPLLRSSDLFTTRPLPQLRHLVLQGNRCDYNFIRRLQSRIARVKGYGYLPPPEGSDEEIPF